MTTVDSGTAFLEKIRANSDRNGAAMRAVPLGVLKDKQKVIFAAQQQAAVTHNTKVAIAASCSVALVAHLGLYEGGDVSDIADFLAHEGFSDWNYRWHNVVSVSAFDTVSAAFSCLKRCNNLKDLLLNCVSLGGDTDSVAAIAVGLASCYQAYDKVLPQNLIETLDEHEYGITFLEQLDRLLWDYVNA